MKWFLMSLLIFASVLSYASDREHVIRFEDGRRVCTIPCDNALDKQNKVNQANEWAKGNPLRQVIVSTDNRNYIKLVDGKIVEMTAEEIEATKPIPPKTEKEKLIELLDDTDVMEKIKKIKE